MALPDREPRLDPERVLGPVERAVFVADFHHSIRSAILANPTSQEGLLRAWARPNSPTDFLHLGEIRFEIDGVQFQISTQLTTDPSINDPIRKYQGARRKYQMVATNRTSRGKTRRSILNGEYSYQGNPNEAEETNIKKFADGSMTVETEIDGNREPAFCFNLSRVLRDDNDPENKSAAQFVKQIFGELFWS